MDATNLEIQSKRMQPTWKPFGRQEPRQEPRRWTLLYLELLGGVPVKKNTLYKSSVMQSKWMQPTWKPFDRQEPRSAEGRQSQLESLPPQ